MQQDNANVITIPPFIYIIALVIGIALRFWIPLQIFFNISIKHYFGWPFIVVSPILAIWAVKTFRKAGEHEDVRKPTYKIVTTGPFQYTRNPMYVSLTLLYIGLAFMINTYWLLLLLPFVLAVLYYGVILREEKYLEKKFGDDYRAYKSKVPRWL